MPNDIRTTLIAWFLIRWRITHIVGSINGCKYYDCLLYAAAATAATAATATAGTVAVSSQRVSGVCCLWTLLHTYLGHRVTVNWAIELQPCHVLLFSVDLRSDHSWMLFAHISIKTLVVRSICLFNREMFRHSYRENMYILVDRPNIDSINSIQNIHRIRYIHNELLCNCHR